MLLCRRRPGDRCSTGCTPIPARCWSACWRSALDWVGSARTPCSSTRMLARGRCWRRPCWTWRCRRMNPSAPTAVAAARAVWMPARQAPFCLIHGGWTADAAFPISLSSTVERCRQNVANLWATGCSVVTFASKYAHGTSASRSRYVTLISRPTRRCPTRGRVRCLLFRSLNSAVRFGEAR